MIFSIATKLHCIPYTPMFFRKITYIAILCTSCMLTACGQKGALYLPTEPEASNRATLPQTLTPSTTPKTQP